MTNEEIKRLICIASGSCGIENFETMPLEKFIKWFEEDIKFDGFVGKTAGQKVLDYFKKN